VNNRQFWVFISFKIRESSTFEFEKKIGNFFLSIFIISKKTQRNNYFHGKIGKELIVIDAII
jgi:hypothetical protein